MSTKALKTQLLAAIAMVLVASIALGSSTYAWFASNTKVDATGMQVTAQSTQAFLLISNEKNTAEEIQTENKTSVMLTVTDEESKLMPAAHETITKAAEAAVDQNKWYTGFSADPTKVEMNAGTKQTLTAFTGYVIHKQVWVTVAKNSTPVKDLSVSATIGNKNTGTITQAKVLVASSDAAAELSSATTAPTTKLTGATTTITDNTVVALDIYIYIDGNDSAVFTNNFNSLDTATISLSFNAIPATV